MGGYGCALVLLPIRDDEQNKQMKIERKIITKTVSAYLLVSYLIILFGKKTINFTSVPPSQSS